jgi:hypothetical protein
MSKEFIRDTTRNRIARKLSEEFFRYYGYKASDPEVEAWRNSLGAMAHVVQDAALLDHGVILEYELPCSSLRFDFLICGRNAAGADEAIIVELKQWSKCKPTYAEGLVNTWVHGKRRDVQHPSVQVGQYQQYLADTQSAFYEGEDPIRLVACSYLHNYELRPDDPLNAAKFSAALKTYPLFDMDAVDGLQGYLKERVGAGTGKEVLERIEKSKYRPSRKLMDHVSDTISDRRSWVLLDEQYVVFEKIRAAVAAARVPGAKQQVILVRGGPGTGKSVLAINLLARFLKEGLVAHYATGSKAYTETLWKLVGSRSKALVKYFNSYRKAGPAEIDALICDEAHRLRATGDTYYTPAEKRSDEPVILELLRAAKVVIFFIDDRQVVRPTEIGSTKYIKQHARAAGSNLSEFDLQVQFRCGGSAGFVNWVNNTLDIERTANVLWTGAAAFDFKILPTPASVEKAVRAKVAEGVTGRIAAGFCWKWSKEPDERGALVNDIVIGDWRKPWNARPESVGLAEGIPPASLWATEPGGLEQVGCVYTAQGFEFDYIGVIWGKDLVYDLDRQTWVGNSKESSDSEVKRSGDAFLDLVKNTYRVLLTRGMKGCYVCFLDQSTERFVRSRIHLIAADPSATDHSLPARTALKGPPQAAAHPVKKRRRVARKR